MLSEREFAELFEERLAEVLRRGTTDGVLDDAMSYACFGGGKRVRPRLVFLGALAAGVSLVHDDLPAMDNDDFRRGRLTVHKKFGEANGILAGDALLTLAGRVLTEGSARFGEKFARAASEIMRGAFDMAAGQVEDLRGVRTEEEFLSMYSLKTSALIRAAMLAGAIVGGGDESCLADVKTYAEALGLAFQLADDLLDAGEPDSFVAVAGENKARDLLAECTQRAVSAAKSLGGGETLAEFALALANRKK